MALTVGSQLGAYEVTALLGEGGMGRVFRAHDTTLGRDVALKVLPDALSRDAERLARLEREAQVLASLNHPHIAAIHHLEQRAGASILVMEFVPGLTLAERIASGSLPFEETQPIAIQIARALEAAHAKGIIHRDLKPANIKITPAGQVKLLDFGLAKALSSDAAGQAPGDVANLSHSPTMVAGTLTGIILGTAAYMSPEQARGQRVDAQTDIWAFGCVLYEMLTGRTAFTGATVTDILAAVVRGEPDWSALPADMPPTARSLLRRCLTKDPAQRLHHVADARIELEAAHADPDAAIAFTSSPSRRALRVAWLSAAVLAVVAAAALMLALRPGPTAAEMRVDIVTPPTTDPLSFAISPDGLQIVFVASKDGVPRLWLRSLDATAAQPLPGTDEASYPFWSPDGRSVGFFSGGLKRTDLGGGSPLTLATAPPGMGGTWGPDGTILFAPTLGSPVLRVPASGGDKVPVTKLAPKETGHRFPWLLPDGRRFLLFVEGSEDVRGIHLASLDSTDRKRLMPAETAATYLPPGWLVFVRQGTLVARRFDAARGALSGESVVLADPVGSNNFDFGAFSVAATGTVAYRANTNARRQLTWFDRSGRAVGTLGSSDDNNLIDPELSPDGRRVAVSRTVQGNTDIWIMDDARAVRLTTDPALDQMAFWSPDGSQIAFSSARKGLPNLYVKASNGAGIEELAFESPVPKVFADWSRDGRFMLFFQILPKTGPDIWVRPLQSDQKPWAFLDSRFVELWPRFSPDSRWVTYQSDESGQNEIYVRPFPGPGAPVQISVAGGNHPRWARNGAEIYYLAADGTLMAARVTIKKGVLEAGTPVALFKSRIVGRGQNVVGRRYQYDVAPDGRFLINIEAEDAATSPIGLLLNWKPPAAAR